MEIKILLVFNKNKMQHKAKVVKNATKYISIQKKEAIKRRKYITWSHYTDNYNSILLYIINTYILTNGNK